MSNSLDLLLKLPTTMMWRGLWDINTQYVKNEIVVSSLDNRTYILIETSSIDGIDPSLNPAWFVFTGSGGAGINSLITGNGIQNIGSSTNPILKNTGVVEVKKGTGGITIGGTPNNPIIACSAVTGFNAGLGILTNGSEIINNGIRHITTGGGLTLSGLFDKTLNMNNILSITAGAGISNIGTAQNLILDNIGATQLLTSPTSGITLSSPTGNITCSNSGVLALTAGNGISIAGNTISTTDPLICNLFNNITSTSGFPVNQPTSVGLITFTTLSPFFNSCMTNGAPDPNGFFMIDLSNFSFKGVFNFSPIAIVPSLVLIAVDSITNTSTTLQFQYSYINNLPTQSNTNLGVIKFSISSIRAAGLRTLTGFKVIEQNGSIFNLTSTGSVNAIYYPNLI